MDLAGTISLEEKSGVYKRCNKVLSRYIPVEGLVAGLPLICIKGRTLGYKSTGRSRIYDSKITINTINLPSCVYAPPINLDKFECHACAIWEDQLYPGHSFSARMDKDPRIYWKTLIEDFTQRDITVPTDRLPAIQAVMNKVKEKYNLTPISGLWRETITTNLHWGPEDGLHSLQPHASHMAPTWSWASLEGKVHWTIGLAGRLPEDDKHWDLKLVGIEHPSPTQPANTHPIRETLLLEGRVAEATVVRSGGRHAVVFHDSTTSFEEFIPEVELVPVIPALGMEGYHYSTRRKKFGETVEDKDWKGLCVCLLLVRTGQSGTSLVIAQTEDDPRYFERIGILIHHPVANFLRYPREMINLQ